MNSLRPQINSHWQATVSLRWPLTAPSQVSALGRPIRPLCQKRATYTTKTYNRTINTTFGNASSNVEQVYRRTISQKCSRSIHTVPTKSPQAVIKGRASYSTEATVAGEPTVHAVFESKTGTWQYVIADPSTLAAAIIDPVLDFDPANLAVTTSSADALLSLVKAKGYTVDKILETHAHADHLSAASYLQKCLTQQQGHRPPIGIGKRIGQVQKLFSQRYAIPREEYDGVFDILFDDDETFSIGDLSVTVMHLPGHTPDHLGYKVGGNVFCGDSLFHADIGTARCDFPGGSANSLFNSGRKLLSLPDHVKIWTGHDYPPEGRDAPVPWLSVRDHKRQNRHLKDGITEEDFVSLRKERDAKLAAPRLLHQSLQMNIRAGQLPKPTESGYRMLHVPLKMQGGEW